MKFMLIILVLCGCATRREVTELRGDLQMLQSYNQRILEAGNRTLGYSANVPKPLPFAYSAEYPEPPAPPMPPLPSGADMVTVISLPALRMRDADPALERMNQRNQAIEDLLQAAEKLKENR